MRAQPRIMSAALGVALVALVAAACGSGARQSPTGPATGAAEQVEVVTWWASGSEKLALDVLASELESQHPEIAFVDSTVAGGAGSSAIDLVQSRLEAGDAPDSFLAHAGAELADYVAAGQVDDVSAVVDELGLRTVIPSGLLELLTIDGALYAVPLSIHRANVVWANRTVLQDAGLDPDAHYPDLASWFVALESLQDAGVDAPLSLATTWAQVQLLETVLLADLGADGYTGLWDGTTDWAGAEVARALADFAQLLTYTNADRESLDWAGATQQVIDGQAAFTVMGDWALVAFDEAQELTGLEYATFPVPGTDGVFDMLADTFTSPTGAPHPDGTAAWLATVGSAAGQSAFSAAKGSIPARADIPPSELGTYQQAAMASFGSDTLVPSLAHGAAAPQGVVNAISAATEAFTAGTTDLAQLQAALVAAAQS